MKGQTFPLVGALISVLVGAILIFSVIIPMLNTATLGAQTLSEFVTNSSAIGDTVTNYTVTNTPVRNDMTYVEVVWWDGSTDATSNVSVVDATNGIYGYTNVSTMPATVTNLTITYRFLDDGYVTDSTARNIASQMSALVVVVLIVGLAGLVYVVKK